MEKGNLKFDFTKPIVKKEINNSGIRKGQNCIYGEFSNYKDKCGIYFIKNLKTNKEYIGSSKNIQCRISKHFGQLFSKTHANKELQKDFNEFGKENFIHGIYEICDADDLLVKEKDFQIKIGINNLYNEYISGTYISKELSEKRSKVDKSSHKTKEYRDKMSKIKSNYIGQFDFNGNGIAIWDSAREIHESLGYTISVILSACNGHKRQAYGYLWRYVDSKGNVLENGYGNKKE